MREIIQISLGKAASAISSKYWRICARECGIEPTTGFAQSKTSELASGPEGAIFQEVHPYQFRPRQVYIDLSINTSDEIFRYGTAELYDPHQLVIGNEGLGFYSNATLAKYDEKIEAAVRKQAEACTSTQGVILNYAFSSHTISTAAHVLDYLRTQFPKKTFMSTEIVPELTADDYTNSALNMLAFWNRYQDLIDVKIPFENSAIYKMTNLTLEKSQKPTYETMNAVTGQLIAALLVSLRNDSPLNCDISEFVTNFVPYPTINTLIAKISPLMPKSTLNSELTTLTNALNLSNMPASLNFVLDQSTKYLAMGMMHIGEVTQKCLCPLYATLATKREYTFVDWAPTGKKIGIVRKIPAYLEEGTMYRSKEQCTLLANNIVMGQYFNKHSVQMEAGLKIPKVVKRYTDAGVEVSQLNENLEDVKGLISDYEECGRDDEPEEEEQEVY